VVPRTPSPQWSLSGVTDCLFKSYTLTGGGQGDTQCNWPGQVTLTPEKLDASDPYANQCLPAMMKGCPQAAIDYCLKPPYVGGVAVHCSGAGLGSS
jgi:hypothetical protein